VIRLKCIVVVLAGLLLVSGAGAATAGTSFAAGGFQGVLAEGANQNVAFSAHQTPTGAVVGYIAETIVFQGEVVSRLRGKVVCLAVSGDTAAIEFTVLSSTGILADPYSVGSNHSLVVRDDPEGDTFGFITADCTTALALAVGQPLFPIEHGNLIVDP
jgi:hypothetical protein